ncbi:hypothetical protein C8Q76DRAFT_610629 [Earliella scabrosa]|nr:hypothetical protein C8Q76DRAFT_610629 [Earliella scabrosa]
MAPLSFTKLFSSRSSNRSKGSDRRSSLDSFESGESYVISLVSLLRLILMIVASVQQEVAEMLDEDNFAWGRPSRKQQRRARS